MPALNKSTDTAKCYANYPQNFGMPFAGHRSAQSFGRDVVVVTDDAKEDPKVGPVVTHMIKHPQ